MPNLHRAAEFGLNRETVRYGRARWVELRPQREEAATAQLKPGALAPPAGARLGRPGAPVTFSAEQGTHLIALACESPLDCALPLSPWTPEALAQEVARACERTVELGVKEKSGILKSRSTRAEFLSDPSPGIRFVYRPKHGSWLNQVERWCRLLVRRLLKRASFSSTEQLRERLLEFMAFFNRTLAQPFNWTYRGRPLQA